MEKRGSITQVEIFGQTYNVRAEGDSTYIHDLARLINPNGRLGIIGVFLPNDAKPVGEIEKRGDLTVPWQTLFRKGITIGMGRDPDECYNTQLRDLIIAGRVKPSQIVSHRLPLSQAPEAFQKFDQRIDGYIKVILDPQR